MSEQALADATASLREIEAGRYRGPLHGVPIGIKDLCYTKGVRTMGGTAVLKDFVPTFDATALRLGETESKSAAVRAANGAGTQMAGPFL